MLTTLDDLRRFTVARNFPKPTTLKRALLRMGFVQADPIRAPARAQDLILFHRVNNHRAGDLERTYQTLDIEEDVFVNYGFVTHRLHSLMHPRSESKVPADGINLPWSAATRKRAQMLLAFIRERGSAHPREVDDYFSHGRVTNYWGGSSNATTHLMDAMHYQGMLRVVKRDKGIRLYAAHQHGPGPTNDAELKARIDELVDVLVNIYAPLHSQSLAFYLRRLRYAVPQWTNELPGALTRAKERLSQATIDGVIWYWPASEAPAKKDGERTEAVRLLAPFDPLVHDRPRFELLWNWIYRFEAYTPAAKRKLGYYAMPMLWREHVIGWANLSVTDGELNADFGYVSTQPRDRVFKRELEAEVERMREFLGLKS
jgi:uncharacterized protein